MKKSDTLKNFKMLIKKWKPKQCFYRLCNNCLGNNCFIKNMFSDHFLMLIKKKIIPLRKGNFFLFLNFLSFFLNYILTVFNVGSWS